MTDLASRARATAIQMTQWRSVTGSQSECDFPHLLRAMLAQNRYFHLNPSHLRVQELNDGTARANLLALVKGEGRKTVVLAAHFDTVPFDDYAELTPYACDPETLLPMIIEKLKRTGENPAALADLESGDYLPGRGLLDMKAGIAAGIAVLEAFAAQERRHGNILLLATPDEEDRSAGMCAAAALLPSIARDSDLDIRLVINLDAIADDGDGSFGRSRLAQRAGNVSPPQPFHPETVQVLSFAELKVQALKSDPDFAASFDLLNRELAERQDLDFPTRARLVTEFVWASTKLPGPAVVLGFGSLPYPAVSLRDETQAERVMAAASEAAAEKGTTISRLGYFPGISDMSFLGETSGDLEVAESNTPIWGASFSLPASPAYPAINIGPWGRDYHHWLERLHVPYAFDVLPHLVLRATKAALE